MKRFLQFGRLKLQLPYLREYSVEIVLFVITLYLLFRVCISKYKLWKRLPPGPIGLPIVGYLPFLGEKPYETLAEMRKTYGDIIGLKFGLKYVVVLNEIDAFREGLSHPASFNRPYQILGPLKLGFGVASGQDWSEQRRYVMHTMRNLGIGRGPWETMNKESARDFVELLKSYKGKPVMITEELQGNLTNNIMSLLYGKRYQPENEKEKIRTLARFSFYGLKYYGPCSPSSFIPGLHKLCEFLGIKDFRKSKEYTKKYLDIAKNEIKKHWSDEDYQNLEDYSNFYKEKFKQMKENPDRHFFTDDNMIGNATSLFIGSSDTTTSSMRTLFRLMAQYGDIQRKVQNELDEVIGREGSISYDERSTVPYTFAVMLEAQRYFSIVPLTTTRELAEDIELGGYLIPKGTALTGNVWAVHNDSGNWKDPHLFQPERFLTEDQKQLAKTPRSFVPFSVGKRNCIGETVAWMVILSVFTAVMQNFNICHPPGEEEETFETIGGVVVHLKPKPLCFIERQ